MKTRILTGMVAFFAACGLAMSVHGYETETVDGITWKYTVSNGEASVGTDSSSDTESLTARASIATEFE